MKEAAHKDGGGKNPSKAYAFTILFSLLAMAVGCFAAFCVFIKGAEEVLVPDAVGRTLEDALVLMQDKELYARITLRHSTEKDKGRILEQEPAAGSIRKGYSRVSLVVSSGAVVDEVENYAGMTLDEVRLHVAAQFAGESKALIVIGQPMYKEDDSPIGTVLAQEPAPGTPISEAVTVRLVVSRGNGSDTVSPPNLNGLGIEAMLNATSSLPLLFDYVSRPQEEGEEPGTVVAMDSANEAVPMWSRIQITLAMPTSTVDGKVYGIFEAATSQYPVAVNMRLVAVTETDDEASLETAGETERNTKRSTAASFIHIGGRVMVPYCVEPGTVLELYAEDTLCAQMTVR